MSLIFDDEPEIVQEVKVEEPSVDTKRTPPSPFDYLKAINETKQSMIIDDFTEKAYNPYIVNRGLSYGRDTIYYANEMNMRHQIGKKMQFDFLSSIIPRGKRYNKWVKLEELENIESIKQWYNCSSDKARVILKTLTKEQVEVIVQRLTTGGLKKPGSKKK